jgi:hypothetical protein
MNAFLVGSLSARLLAATALTRLAARYMDLSMVMAFFVHDL